MKGGEDATFWQTRSRVIHATITRVMRKLTIPLEVITTTGKQTISCNDENGEKWGQQIGGQNKGASSIILVFSFCILFYCFFLLFSLLGIRNKRFSLFSFLLMSRNRRWEKGWKKKGKGREGVRRTREGGRKEGGYTPPSPPPTMKNGETFIIKKRLTVNSPIFREPRIIASCPADSSCLEMKNICALARLYLLSR